MLASRVNISVAIICMVKKEDQSIVGNTSTVAMVTDDPDDPCGSLDTTDPGYEVMKS